MKVKRYRWWYGVAFYVGVQAAQLGLRAVVRSTINAKGRGTRREDRESYKAKRLPVFAPPGAVFPIAWGINSVSTIAGGCVS